MQRDLSFPFLGQKLSTVVHTNTYMMDALKAVGFGPVFRRSVRLMYDTNRPPQRRIYANGYYSDWFSNNKFYSRWSAQTN